MKIAIADDELYVCQQIRECLLQYSTQKNVDMDAPDIYTDCRTLYNTDLNGKRYDVVFMDIDFSGENNIARLSSDNYAVRERCSDGLAPVTFQKIARALDDMLYYRDISRRIFECTSNKSLVHVQVSHIRYLNSCGRKVYLQTTDSRISFYGKLSEVQQEPCFSSFIQIHKSYLVNPDYIDHISSNTVFLQGNSHEQLPISRAYQPLVEQWLMKG